MNPALLNYLQSQGSQGSPQMDNPSPQPPSYNPFDQGIRKAIESAQESLGMTDKQQDKALRRSMLTFANNIAQQPKERGFFNNFGAAARALSPAIMEHDLAEDESLAQNNALANQIIGHRRADETRQMVMEDRAWNKQHAENQLDEQRRYHDLSTGNQKWSQTHAENQLEEQRRYHDLVGNKEETTKKKEAEAAEADLKDILNRAEEYIEKSSNKGSKNRMEILANDWLPGGYRPNQEQGSVDVLGDVLKGKLFNAWGYRNQAEFNHVPSISSSNTPGTNLAIIKQLKELLLKNSTIMVDPDGNEYNIPEIDIKKALDKGLQPIK